MNLRHVRPEERLAKELRATRAGVSEAQRPTGTELFQTVDAINSLSERIDTDFADVNDRLQDIIDSGVTSQGGTIYPLSYEPPTPPESGFTDKDVWYAADENGKPFELRSWNGSSWVRLTTLADQILVHSPDGTISLADGIVKAPALAADAIDGKTIRGVRVEGGTFEGGTYKLTSRIDPVDVMDEEFSIAPSQDSPFVGGPFSLVPGIDGNALLMLPALVDESSENWFGSRGWYAGVLLPFSQPDDDLPPIAGYTVSGAARSDFSGIPFADSPGTIRTVHFRAALEYVDKVTGQTKTTFGSNSSPINSTHQPALELGDGWQKIEMTDSIWSTSAESVVGIRMWFSLMNFYGADAEDVRVMVDNLKVERVTVDSRALEIERNEEGVPELVLRENAAAGEWRGAKLSPRGLSFWGDDRRAILLRGNGITGFEFYSPTDIDLEEAPIRLAIERSPFRKNTWEILTYGTESTDPDSEFDIVPVDLVIESPNLGVEPTVGDYIDDFEKSLSLLRLWNGIERRMKLYVPASTSIAEAGIQLFQDNVSASSRLVFDALGNLHMQTYGTSPTTTGKRPVPFGMAVGAVSQRNVQPGGVTNVSVTFPSGRFTRAPRVTATVWGDARDTTVNIDSVSASGFTCRLGSMTTVVRRIGAHWQAVQMTSGNTNG